MAAKKGCQTPTQSAILPFAKSYGTQAVKLYEGSGRKAIRWQKDILRNIMGVGKDGLWVHQKFGFSVPRRNGKNEIITIRELWGLKNGEVMCHTAHRTTTSHQAWVRLCRLLADSGYTELGRPKQGEKPPEKSYRLTKQYGLESIRLTDGGEIVFRTRTPNGGLGEGFDLLVIDEAQEYTEAQETALVYTVSDSRNPQTLFCGTPPTAASSGTVFQKMRDSALAGESYETGWAEWSLPDMVEDIWDAKQWYKVNPSMGYHLDERKIRSEIRGDRVDFNIQRLGVWIKYNQKSAIPAVDWERLKTDPKELKLTGRVYCGVKYGHDGENAALAAAVAAEDGRVYVEVLGCRPVRDGTDWIVSALKSIDCAKTAIDGANGQKILADAMKDARMRRPVLPTVKEFIAANAVFEQAVFGGGLCHGGQDGLAQVVGNCKKRNIGSSGGFGYAALRDGDEIAVMDAVIIAHWLCAGAKDKKKQAVRY